MKRELSSVATIIMGTSPSGDTYNKNGIGLPLLNGPTEFGLNYPTCTLFTTDSSKECKAGDLIFCVRESTTGRMNWADKVYSLGRGVCAIRGETDLDTKFIRYCIEDNLQSLLNMAGGGTFPNLTKESIHSFKIPYPENRQRIADILSTYDDLIINNTRRIDILEKMSQVIYHEWFGQIYKESLPKGWKTVKVADMCNVGRGSSPRPIADQIYFEGGMIPWIKIADATKSGKYLYETKEHVNEYCASFSRLLPKGSLILSVDGCVHDGWLYINEFDGATRDYLYYVFKSKQVFFNNSAYGAAIQNINTTILREMEIILPPIEIQNKFSNYISEIDQLLQNIEKSNANLRQTRDLLLPRLVSGEVEV